MTEGKRTTELPEKLDLRPEDIAEEKHEELRHLFPETLTEGGKIDFDKLKLSLGEDVETGKERYGLTWPGKAACFKTIQSPSLATLRPCPEESVSWDSTENLIIEGDNLEVLKLLQKSYLGKIKMIYIDPPYNTGNDFIYPDNYTESLQTYLEYTGQVDPQGKKFSTNTDTDGRFHSKWLNMMYPRLYLARNLLTDDGVMFISIDDHEVDNLKKLVSEVFGEENFIALLAVQLNPRGRHLDDFIARTHEYILVAARDAVRPSTMFGLEKEGNMVDEYDKQDSQGRYRELGLRNRNQAFNPRTRPTLYYPLYVNPDDGSVSTESRDPYSIEVWPKASDGVETCWTWSRDRVNADATLLRAREVGKAQWQVFRKDYLLSPDGQIATTLPRSLWVDRDITNDYGRRAVKELLGDVPLEFPKAPELIKRLIQLATDPESIILDFFAGSGTTAQAVLELVRAGSGNRKFILVQLPEPTGRDDYPTIAEVTKERVRRVIENGNKQDTGKLNLDPPKPQDRGFRVFKLDESNFVTWDAEGPADADDLEEQLALHVSHIRERRTDSDLLHEVLLKSGFTLTTRVETLTLAGKTVYAIAEGALLVCLARPMSQEVIDALAAREPKPERVVCLDEAFVGNDQLKVNANETFRTRGVTSFKTV